MLKNPDPPSLMAVVREYRGKEGEFVSSEGRGAAVIPRSSGDCSRETRTMTSVG